MCRYVFFTSVMESQLKCFSEKQELLHSDDEKTGPLIEETGKMSPLLLPVSSRSIASPASLLILIMNHVLLSIPSVCIQ